MKKYSIFKYVVCVMTLMAVLVSCSDSSESILLGSDDQLHFSSAEDGRNFTVCATGAWQITTDAQWLSFSKSNGEGDGQTREQIVITAARNTGTARQASFQLTAAGKTLTVTCDQEEGRPFTWGAPSLSSSLQVGHPATGLTVNIPYEYGYKGMKFTLHASFSGEASEGLSMEDETFTLDAATGILSLPLGGTPVKSGQLTITIQADQADVAAVSLGAKVSDWIILEQHFDLCIYGGDFVAGHPGTMPKWAKDDEGKNILPDPLGELQKRTANQDGSNDLFATMAHSYLVSKGLEGWEGSKVYERPGYIKMGTAKDVGKVTTPALEALGTGKSDVEVSLRVAEWFEEEGGSLAISLEGSGTLSVTKYVYKHTKTKGGSEWEDVKFTIRDASADTRLVFTTKGNKRFAIDDIVISKK